MIVGTRGRAATIALGLASTALFVWLTFRRVDAAALLGELRRVPWWMLGPVLLLKGLALAGLTARARVLLTPVRRVPALLLFRSQLVAIVGNNVLPLRIGEMLRIGYLDRACSVPAESAAAAVVLERLLDLLLLGTMLAALVAGVVIEVPRSASLYVMGGLALVALLASLGISRRPGVLIAASTRVGRLFGPRVEAQLSRRVSAFAQGLAGLSSSRAVALAIAWTGLYWAAAGGTVFAWMVAFGFELPWYAPAVVLAFLSFGAALPSSPGFVGTYHFFAATALAVLGVDPTRAASFAIVLHAATIIPVTVVGGLYLSSLGLGLGPARGRPASRLPRSGTPETP